MTEGAHVLMGTALPEEAGPRPVGLVCSQYVARCFRAGGLPFCDKADLDTSPTEIATSAALELMGPLRVAPSGP